MAHIKISVTVPEEVFSEIRKMAAMKKTKVSRLVTEALAEKIKKAKEEAFVSSINMVFEDPEVVKDQTRMTEDIANSMNMRELPW